MDTLERVLAEHPFFRDLPARHLSLVVGCASQIRFAPGEFVFRTRFTPVIAQRLQAARMQVLDVHRIPA
jgi:hypothetical protein